MAKKKSAAEIVAAALASGPEDPDAVLAELNAKYMVVNEAGKTVVYKPEYDPLLQRKVYQRITFDDFRKLYMNRVTIVGHSKSGEPKYGDVGGFWLHHPGRRQYVGGLMFDPTGREQDGVLNLWGGFAYKAKPGDWDLMKEHVRLVLCGGNEACFQYLMGWTARLVQKPGEQGEVAVVMRGLEGTGKGIFARALRKLFGQHGIQISSPNHLVGRFNAHLRDCVLLFADEAFFAGDKAHVGALKRIITEDTLTVEGKYQNAVPSPNFVHLIMASNEDWVVPASLSARRFLVLEVGDGRRGDFAYFKAIQDQMDNGGYEAMLHELLNYDLTGFDVRRVPDTAGLNEQKKLSLPTFESWWMDVLQRGYVYESRYGHAELGEWHQKVATELLYSSYLAHAKASGDRHPLTREAFGRKMKAAGARHCYLFNVPVGEKQHGVTLRVKPPGYRLGTLTDARVIFCERTKLAVEWPEEDQGEEPWEDEGAEPPPPPANDDRWEGFVFEDAPPACVHG